MTLRIGPFDLPSPFLLAPMAGVSEMPFRVIVLEKGAGLATTELISAKGIFYKNQRTRQYMTYDEKKERPFSLQLFGGDIESMAHAAREAMNIGADMVDINMGCPVKKVTKTGSGSALMTDPNRAAELVRRMVESTEGKIPITAKMRTGWDHNSVNCCEVGHALAEAGCAALGLHGRTTKQAYTGQADWSLIKKLKDTVDVPVLGNGDVKTPDDARRMMRETGCDGVLIGRGALGNPWIFEALAQGHSDEPSPETRCHDVAGHLDAHVAFHKLFDSEALRAKRKYTPEQQAIRTFRQHLIWYSRGLQQGAAFRKVAVHLETYTETREAILRFFGGLTDDASRSEEVEGVNYKQAFG